MLEPSCPLPLRWFASPSRWRLRLAAILAALAFLVLSLPALGAPGESVPIAPGASYRQVYRPDGPWAINIVEAELTQPYLQLHSLLGQGSMVGKRAVSNMLASQASDGLAPVAAVNGDYFAMAGGAYTTIPLGFQVESGELVTFPDPTRSAFYVLSDGSAHIGRLTSKAWLLGPNTLLYPIAGLNRPPEHGELVLFTSRFGKETRAPDSVTQILLTGLSGPPKSKGEVCATVGGVTVCGSQPIPTDAAVLAANGVAAYALRRLKQGDRVQIRVSMDPDVGEIKMAIGGGPRLVREGRSSIENRVERFADSFTNRRHPRTGVGLRDNVVVMVTVDGRQPGYSDGMTLREFAQLFIDLGYRDAVNLDGGGSTTMVVRNRIVNSPSDGAERRVANALALFSSAPVTGKPVRLAVEPAEADVLTGEKLPLVAKGLDEYYNPVAVDPKMVRWETGPLGQVDEQGNFVAASVNVPTAGLITARYGEMMAAAVVSVVPAPTRLTITPERVTILARGTQQFVVHGYDQDNRPVRFAPGRVTWTVEPAASSAKIDGNGLLRAPSGEAALTVTGRIGDIVARAEALVGAVTTVLADFEAASTWSYSSTPQGLPGGVSRADDPLRRGNHCLRLRYDFSQGGGTRTAEVVLKIPLSDTRTISVRVLGDGQGGWLRARVRDAADRPLTVDLALRVDWSGQWRRLTAWMPEDAVPPLTLEAIYLTEYHADRKQAGEIYLDDVGAEKLPDNGTAAAKKEQPGEKSNPSPSAKEKTVGMAEPSASLADLPTYVVRQTRDPVTIDGKLDEAVWSRLPAVGDFRLVKGEGEPQLPTELKLCWDQSNLYLAFTAIDTDIWGTMRNRDDPIYEEEVVEAFLSSGGDVTRYYEFEWSPHNVIFDARIHCPNPWGDRSTMTPDIAWDCTGCRSAVQVVGTLDRRDDIDQCWIVEVALPFAEIGRGGRPPGDGEQWRANFFRVDHAGGGEFSCWSPTLKGDFHVPARFGTLVFSH